MKLTFLFSHKSGIGCITLEVNTEPETWNDIHEIEKRIEHDYDLENVMILLDEEENKKIK